MYAVYQLDGDFVARRRFSPSLPFFIFHNKKKDNRKKKRAYSAELQWESYIARIGRKEGKPLYRLWRMCVWSVRCVLLKVACSWKQTEGSWGSFANVVCNLKGKAKNGIETSKSKQERRLLLWTAVFDCLLIKEEKKKLTFSMGFDEH